MNIHEIKINDIEVSNEIMIKRTKILRPYQNRVALEDQS